MVNIIINKIRFYFMKMWLIWNRNKTILRICLNRRSFYTFILSILLCVILSQIKSYGLPNVFEAILNICYSYIAGYVFYLVSDVYPKTARKVEDIKNVILDEICILLNAKGVLDTTIKFSRNTYHGTEKIKGFIINISKKNPYKNNDKLIELEDIFLKHLYFIQNECKNAFNILLNYKAHLLGYDEISILLEIKDFIFLNNFYNKENIYLLKFEIECQYFTDDIQKLEHIIEKQIDSYVYNPYECDRLKNKLRKANNFGMINLDV